MRAAEIVAAGRISEVWAALGGDRPKHGRARAFFREGNNSSAVSLNDAKGCWFDYRDGVGGGVLDLIQRVQACDRSSALHWLAELNGVALEDQNISAAERRECGRRAHRAKQEAEDLILWKGTLIDALKRERERWWEIYHASLRYLLDVGMDAPLSDLMAELHEVAEIQLEICDSKTETLVSAPYTGILPVFRQSRVEVAA